jgi:hypothetical protein
VTVASLSRTFGAQSAQNSAEPNPPVPTGRQDDWSSVTEGTPRPVGAGAGVRRDVKRDHRAKRTRLGARNLRDAGDLDRRNLGDARNLYRRDARDAGQGHGIYFFLVVASFVWARSLPATLLTVFGVLGLLRSFEALEASLGLVISKSPVRDE